MYLKHPPKDSFFYIATQQSESAKTYLRTLNSLLQAPHLTTQVSRVFSASPRQRLPRKTYDDFAYEIALQTFLSETPRPKDYVMSDPVCSLLFRSGMENTPYSSFSTDTAFTYIDISATDLEFDATAYSPSRGRIAFKRKILGCVILNMSLVNVSLKRALIAALRAHKPTSAKLASALSSGYVFIVIGDTSAANVPPYDLVLFATHEPVSDADLAAYGVMSMNDLELIIGAYLSAPSGPDDDRRTAAQGIALDLAVKSVLFIKHGEFEESVVPFEHGKDPVAKAAPKVSPARQEDRMYRVSYIKEQSGGHSIPWLIPTQESEQITDALEIVNQDRADAFVDAVEKGTQSTPRVIPDHVKLIWVTQDYVEKKGIPASEIIDTADVSRRWLGGIVTKRRHLIAKDYVYGYGVSLEDVKSDTVRVGLKKRRSPSNT